MKELQDIREIYREMVSRKWFFAKVFLFSLLVAGLVFKFLKPQYEVRASWIPKEQGLMDGNLNMAIMAGITSSMGMGGNSAENLEKFYEDLIFSFDFLQELTTVKWKLAKGSKDSTTLEEYYGIDREEVKQKAPPFADLERAIQERVIKELRDDLNYDAGSLNILKVKTLDPSLSFAISRKLIEKLQKFTEQQRRFKADRETAFVKERLEEYEGMLSRQEIGYTQFLQVNTEQNSPRIMLRRQQLERELSIQLQLVLEFRKRYELAKIEAIKAQDDFMFIETPKHPNGSLFLLKLLTVFFSFFVINFLGLSYQFLSSWLRVATRNVD